MSKVYIIQDLGNFNFLPAEEFGEVTACLTSRVSYYAMTRAFSQLHHALRNLGPDDWLVPTGHPALIAYAGYVMAMRTGKLRVLVWDNQTRKYVPTEYEVK